MTFVSKEFAQLLFIIHKNFMLIGITKTSRTRTAAKTFQQMYGQFVIANIWSNMWNIYP